MHSIMEERSVLRDRLASIQNAVHKATDDAWKQQQQSQQQSQPPSLLFTTNSNSNSTNSQNSNNKSNDNASFLLGMDLFGQDTSVLERTVRDKLEDLEGQLKQVLQLLQQQQQQQFGISNDSSFLDDNAQDITNEEENQDPEAAAALVKTQVQTYQRQIQFLQHASLARSQLDESLSLSSAALAPEPNIVQASQRLVQALDHLNQAQEILDADQTMPSSPPPTSSAREPSILQGLQHSLRRQRVELVHKACGVLDSSIQLSLGPNTNDNSSNNNNNNSNATATATVTAATTTTNGTANTANIASAASNALSAKASTHYEDALQVLETLEGGHQALEDTLRRLTRQLYQDILSPVLEPHRHHRNNNQNKNKSSPTTPLLLPPWKITTSADQPTKGWIGVSTSTSKGPIHRLEWHRSSEEDDGGVGNNKDDTARALLETPMDQWKDTLHLLQTILHFVQSKILLERPKLCHFVGQKLFGTPNALPTNLNLQALGLEATLLGGDDQGLLMETLVELMSRTCLPDSLTAKEIPTLANRSHEMVQLCSPFCQALIKYQLLPKGQSNSNKLVKFCQSLEANYIQHRRCVLLNQARDVLLQNNKSDYHNTVTVGVPQVMKMDDPLSVFQLHQSNISETAHKLMALVRQTMDECVQMPCQPQRLRPTLYQTAREMLSLFRAIIPALHGAEVAHVPRTAAVLHNDCLYLAHHCLTLGLEYKEQLSSLQQDEQEDARGKLLQQTCIFVDMVPLFRELADTSLNDMLELQTNQLVDIVGSRIEYLGQALESHESLHEWSEAETGLAAATYHLRHLSQAWKPILSTQIFGRCMGHLVDVVITLYWKPITMFAPKISPSARHFLVGLVTKAADDFATFLSCSSDSSSSNTTNNNNVHDHEEFAKVSQEWYRWQALLQFCKMSTLQDVEIALTQGDFRTIASQELARWMEAAFDDSAERRSLLNTLNMV